MRTPAPDLVPQDDEIRRLVSLVASRLNEREREITQSMTELLSHIDYLNDDQRLVTLLEASIGANVSTILHMLINDIPVANLRPATAAVEYAERLAQRGVPANSLVRAYHMGQDDLMAQCFEEAQRLDCDSELKLRVVHQMSGLIYQYIDWICLYLLDIYEAEQQRWNTTAGHVRTAMLHAVLAGGDAPAGEAFEAETRYGLRQYHVGMVVWADDDGDALRNLQGAVRRLAAGGAGEPMFSAVDRSTAWVWLPRGRTRATVDSDEVRRELAKIPGGRAALGLPGGGVEGFRRTHAQAEAARSVALVAGLDVVNYADEGIAAISMLTHDMESLRAWVREVLGDLAYDAQPYSGLRDTLRTYFSHGSHQVATAEALVIHRNTLKYRLEKARSILGHPLDQGRLDVELALQACHYLGPSVLRASATG
ncbi:MAG: helix-turn-helix domain-containing protein [Aeromicrobium sp.]|uniref:PucR family transcriptional regulator n=1 Tax=Aeromicrobium sp. TaxID=1871063 RepID=UPI0039E22921